MYVKDHMKNPKRKWLLWPALCICKMCVRYIARQTDTTQTDKWIDKQKVCPMTGKSKLASLVLFFPPSASFFSFLSFFLSSMDLPRPVASKSLFMRTIKWSKALNSVAVPRGPVAFLSLVSCSIPFRRVDERAWCTNKKSKQQAILRKPGHGIWREKKEIQKWNQYSY